MKTIDIKKIKVKFGGKHEPKDQDIMALFKKAYTGELLCHIAVIDVKGIQPFSDFKPTISKQYRAYFDKQIQAEDYTKIYVYPKGNKFIMSDDYSAYYLYLEKSFKEIKCIVLGEPLGKYVLDKGEAFRLPLPKKFQVIK